LILVRQGNADRGRLKHAAPAFLAGSKRILGAPTLRNLQLELCCTFTDAAPEFGVRVIKRCCGTLPFTDLVLEQAVSSL
jgi:hypothetical protein